MALPSAVSIGSLAFVVAAGVGLVALTTGASDDPSSPAVDRPAAQHQQASPDQRTETDSRPDHAKRRREAVPKVLVELYNNTGVTAVASKYAKELEGAGWNVAATDNWYGVIPDNTVYYPPTMKDAAEQLAEALQIDRLRPSVSPMRFDRLTVIFTLPA